VAKKTVQPVEFFKKKDGPAQIDTLIIPVNFNNPCEAVTVKTFVVDVDVITFSVMNMNL
jgi:hypothetical protein